MMKWVKLAFRNILRNKRRSFITIIAIGIGFASIGLCTGYMHRAYKGIRFIAICGEGLGHLRINKPGWQEKGKLEPEKYMFSKEETEKIMKLVGEEKEVRMTTPQIQVTGVVTNRVTSAVFIAEGIVPKDENILIEYWIKSVKNLSKSYLNRVKGQPLSDETPYGVLIARDLAKYLNLKLGDQAMVMAQTSKGQMNVLDVEINGIYDTGNDYSNDKFMMLNFYFAQSLLDTKSAERVLVLLKDWRETERMRKVFLKKLKAAGIDCEIRTWDKLSLGYAKTKSYLDTVFLFLCSIVLVIAVIGTINTMGMTIMERTKEIGSLRALGLKFRGVTGLFALEGAFLGLFGSIVGIIMHTCVWALITFFPFYYTPPGLSEPIAIMVDMVPWALIVLLVCFILLSTIAAIIPARGAARKNIVDALGHV